MLWNRIYNINNINIHHHTPLVQHQPKAKQETICPGFYSFIRFSQYFAFYDVILLQSNWSIPLAFGFFFLISIVVADENGRENQAHCRHFESLTFHDRMRNNQREEFWSWSTCISMQCHHHCSFFSVSSENWLQSYVYIDIVYLPWGRFKCLLQSITSRTFDKSKLDDCTGGYKKYSVKMKC